MGRLIVCRGYQAASPYYFKITDTKVYTIEELCYYIYNNIDILNKGFFEDSLRNWMEEELKLEDGALKLKELIIADADLKEIVKVILSSCDYYSDTEIKQLLRYIEEMEKMTPFQKKKKKADNYLKYRQFTEAETEYKEILNGKEISILTSEEYGNIVHNLAFVQLNTVGVSIAAGTFKEAYERNHNIESLKSYLSALIISKQDELFLEEAESYHIDTELQEQIKSELNTRMEEAEHSEEYKNINQLKEYKTAGKITQFYQTATELLEQWKKEYRRENA